MSMSSANLLQSQSEEMENEFRALSVTCVERRQLLELLSRVTAVSDNIKTRINAIALVSRLPPEILIHIFSILQKMQPTSWFSGGTHATGLRWMIVTHVCRSWRNIAISCPALWTKNTFSLGSPWAECMLSRSQQVQIKIEYRMKDHSTPAEQDAKLIAKHLFHTYSLTISTANTSLSPFLQEITAPAPALHMLDIADSDGYTSMRDSNLIASIPGNFLGNGSPSLRDLRVFGAFIPWTSSLLRNLETLHLSVPSLAQRPAHCIPTLSQLLDALEQMPDLHTLDIDGVLPSFSPSRDVLFPVDRKVVLPHLIDLSLGRATLDVALVLSRLITPLTSSLNLSCQSCNDANDAASLFRIISDHFNTANPISITNLQVVGGDHFEVWGTMTFPSSTSHQLFITFEQSICDPELLHQFLLAIPQLQISGIEMNNMLFMSRSKWQRVFAHESMASVKSVAIDEPHCLRGFTKCLSSQPAAHVRKLRSLKCINMDFLGMQPWFDRLQEVLQMRKEIGMPLQKISFYQCLSVGEEWITRLEDIVPSVIVSDDEPSDAESSDGESDGSSDDDLDGPLDDRFGESSDDEQ